MKTSNLKKQNYGACIAIEITGDTIEETKRIATTLYNCGVLAKPIDDIETRTVVGLSSKKKLKEGLEAYFFVTSKFEESLLRFSKNGHGKKRFSFKNQLASYKAQDFIAAIPESIDIIVETKSDKYYYKTGNANYSNATDSNWT